MCMTNIPHGFSMSCYRCSFVRCPFALYFSVSLSSYLIYSFAFVSYNKYISYIALPASLVSCLRRCCAVLCVFVLKQKKKNHEQNSIKCLFRLHYSIESAHETTHTTGIFTYLDISLLLNFYFFGFFPDEIYVFFCLE